MRGFRTRFHLYTVPGQVFYDASRKLILKAWTASSRGRLQGSRQDANIESLDNLRINLRENGFDLMAVPFALQFNKRDMPTAMPYDLMLRELNVKGEPTFEAVATKGVGVFETLKAVAKQVLHELSRK